VATRKLVIANNPLLSGPAMQDRERGGIPYRELSIELIDRDPNQPRVSFDEERLKELSESIRLYGVMSPILVRPAKVTGRYILIAGERRLRASQLVGRTVIPALIDRSDESDTTRTLSMQLVENLQRADLSPLERAHAIGALRDAHNLSVRDIADNLGISKSMVQRSLEILELPDDLLNALREGAAESKVLLLSKIDDPDIRQSYLKDLDVLTRKQLENDIERSHKKPESSMALSAEDQRITGEIERALGLKVRMAKSSPDADNGRLIIEFYSAQDLQEISRRLVVAN
jgi:ParB family transcriptional regulator, chromosome partitioning protein